MASEAGVLGDQVSDYLLSIADDLYYNRIPLAWCRLAGHSAPHPTCGVAQFLNELGLRCQHFEKILSLRRERIPRYRLGAFLNPRALLAILKQETMRNVAGERSGNFDHFVFQTEVTSREKDHVSLSLCYCVLAKPNAAYFF